MSKSDMRARRDSMECILCEVNGKALGLEAASGEKRASQSSTFAAAAARSESCKMWIKSVLGTATTTTSDVRHPSYVLAFDHLQCLNNGRDSVTSDNASLMQ
jgi:hypothetical protein